EPPRPPRGRLPAAPFPAADGASPLRSACPPQSPRPPTCGAGPHRPEPLLPALPDAESPDSACWHAADRCPAEHPGHAEPARRKQFLAVPIVGKRSRRGVGALRDRLASPNRRKVVPRERTVLH